MSSNSSGGTVANLFLILKVDKVLIWLIFTQDRLGNFDPDNSNVSGNPAFCG